MKILSLVETYLPTKCGMSEVVSRLSELWVLSGHKVSVATGEVPGRSRSIRNVEILEFSLKGNMVNGYLDSNRSEILRYQDFILNGQWDVICVFAAQQWSCDLFLEVMERVNAKKVFIPTGFSGLYLKDYSNYFERMKVWLTKFDANVFLSKVYRDFKFADKYSNNNVLIPNGASVEEFNVCVDKPSLRERFKIPKENKVLLAVGSHTGMKGHAELYKISRKLKSKNVSIVIVGNFLNKQKKRVFRQPFPFLRKVKYYLLNFEKYKHARRCPEVCWKEIERGESGVLNLSLTRRELVEMYHLADLFILPSKIECSPIVLFEAAASRTPFLVSNVGNSKEILGWFNGGGEILPGRTDRNGYCHINISKSARVVDRWLNRSDLAEVGECSHEIWRTNFTWEKISDRYLKLFESLTS